MVTRRAATPDAWRLPSRVTATTILVGVLLSGCELDAVNVAPPAPQVVVHAVLNADADEQVILVESSLTGRVRIDSTVRFDPLDPIRSAGGEPLSGASAQQPPR